MAKFKLENSAAQNQIAATKMEEPTLANARRIDINKIVPNPFQVRQNFDSLDAREALKQLADDISERGILQPLVVRQIAPDKYEIVAGERRYRAAKEAKKTWLPVVVYEMDDEQARMASLVENVQRKDLDVDDEARFLAALKNEYTLSDSEIARRINKSQTYVTKRLKLAEHPDLLAKVREGKATINSAYNEAVSRHNPKSSTDGRSRLVRATKRNSQLTNVVIDARDDDLFLGNSFKHISFQRFNEALDEVDGIWNTLTADERNGIMEALDETEKRITFLRQRVSRMERKDIVYEDSTLIESIAEDFGDDTEGDTQKGEDDFGFLPTPSRSTVRNGRKR